jgi:hypothetical protein
MVCPTCGLENDPSSTTCARCNTALVSQPAEPTAPIYGRPPRGPGRLPMFAVAAAVLLIAVVAAVIMVNRSDRPAPTPNVLPPAGPTPTAAPTAAPATTEAPSIRDQAIGLDSLLDQSIASRHKLNAAIDLVNRCTTVSAALGDMRDVGTERQQQLDTLGSADLSALPQGEQLRGTLGDALRNALAADQGFVSWTAPTVSGGCANTAGRRAAYAQAQSASKRAQSAKKQFLAIWNPIASAQGLAQRSNTDI